MNQTLIKSLESIKVILNDNDYKFIEKYNNIFNNYTFKFFSFDILKFIEIIRNNKYKFREFNKIDEYNKLINLLYLEFEKSKGSVYMIENYKKNFDSIHNKFTILSCDIYNSYSIPAILDNITGLTVLIGIKRNSLFGVEPDKYILQKIPNYIETKSNILIIYQV